jgi:hypothetical protein
VVWRECESKDHGVKQLPGDLVDEGKLLLFMKDVVTSRAPKKEKRVTHEKNRHLEAQEVKKAVKKQKFDSGMWS